MSVKEPGDEVTEGRIFFSPQIGVLKWIHLVRGEVTAKSHTKLVNKPNKARDDRIKWDVFIFFWEKLQWESNFIIKIYFFVWK